VSLESDRGNEEAIPSASSSTSQGRSAHGRHRRPDDARERGEVPVPQEQRVLYLRSSRAHATEIANQLASRRLQVSASCQDSQSLREHIVMEEA